LNQRSANAQATKPSSALAKAPPPAAKATPNASALKQPNASVVATASNQPARGSALTNGSSAKDSGHRPDKKGQAKTPFNDSGNCPPDQVWDPAQKRCVPKSWHHEPPGPQSPNNNSLKR
jgi:hypothetical protein